MRIRDIITLKETVTAGGTTSGSIATTPFGKTVKSNQVGTLFGGTYKQTKRKKKK